MAGESVYGPHDYLVGEGADIAEAGEPAFLRRSLFWRCRTGYASKPMPASGSCIGFTYAMNRSPKPDVGWKVDLR